jgi:PAS domain-containing protein
LRMATIEKDLLAENQKLIEELEQYKDLVEAIRNGGVDALAINKNGTANIFSLESSDFAYRVLVENFPDGAMNVSEKGLIVYANPAFETMMGEGSFSSAAVTRARSINYSGILFQATARARS